MTTPYTTVMVSAPERQAVCTETTRHLIRDLGLRRILYARNRADEPACHTTHGILARRAIASALSDFPDTPVLFLEDDIRFDVALAHLTLPFLSDVAQHRPVTLYLPDAGPNPGRASGQDWYPFPLPGDSVMLDLFPIRRQADWWGSQALLLPPSLCRELLASPLAFSLDAVLRHVLADRPLWGLCPDLVQHIGLPSISEFPAPIHHSVTFGRGNYFPSA
jgi:hypothetical protein